MPGLIVACMESERFIDSASADYPPYFPGDRDASQHGRHNEPMASAAGDWPSGTVLARQADGLRRACS